MTKVYMLHIEKWQKILFVCYSRSASNYSCFRLTSIH